MNGLVGYASSDEDDDIQPEKPAKVAKLEAVARNEQAIGLVNAQPRQDDSPTRAGNEIDSHAAYTAEEVTTNDATDSNQPQVQGPTSGPSAPPPQQSPTPPPVDENGQPISPFTYAQLRRRELTMPRVPNFSIPDSPPGPSDPEELTQLATTTKKFTRFLELKKQGVHFNERLQNSVSLRNPSLLPKLMEFAGIGPDEQYASTLPVGGDLEGWGGVQTKWPKEWYFESLVKENMRREKKRMKERIKPEFVSSKSSAQSSAKVTPERRH